MTDSEALARYIDYYHDESAAGREPLTLDEFLETIDFLSVRDEGGQKC